MAWLYRLDFDLEDGLAVVVVGRPEIYVKTGRFSLAVETILLAGEGNLRRAYEMLKNRLASEGLFDISRKRPLPPFARSIGIITSSEGAAIGDIVKVIQARWGGVHLYLAPVAVQGERAVEEIIGAISYFNERRPVDVLIIGRGGGSLEDLQAFNSERVARAVADSRIPVPVSDTSKTSRCVI